MIEAIHKALYAFWSRFRLNGVPIAAYLTGLVPTMDDGNGGQEVSVPFPYFTFSVSLGAGMTSGILTGTIWCRAESGVNVNDQRAKILGLVADAVPESGLRIDTDRGFFVLYRNTTDFQTYYDDPEDPSVVGGRTSFLVRYYMH